MSSFLSSFISSQENYTSTEDAKAPYHPHSLPILIQHAPLLFIHLSSQGIVAFQVLDLLEL